MVLPSAPVLLELVALGSAPCLLLEEHQPRGVFLVHGEERLLHGGEDKKRQETGGPFLVPPYLGVAREVRAE